MVELPPPAAEAVREPGGGLHSAEAAEDSMDRSSTHGDEAKARDPEA